MKNEIETGIKTFIEDALTERAGDVLPVYAASGDEEIDETTPYIVAKINDIPHFVGGIAHAELEVIVSSPHATGYETLHRETHRFLRTIFSVAIPPNLPINAAHISEAIWAATDSEVAGTGFHVTGYPGGSGSGWQQDGIAITLGVCYGALASLTSVGAITVA